MKKLKKKFWLKILLKRVGIFKNYNLEKFNKNELLQYGCQIKEV